MPEISGNNLLKIGSQTYISAGNNYLYSNIQFVGTTSLTYTDFTTNIESDKFRDTYPLLSLESINLDNHEEFSNGFYRKVTPLDKKIIENNVTKGVLLYFPHSRYDHPETTFTWRTYRRGIR